MLKKRIYIISLTALLSLILLTPPAWAGNTQRDRWEGIAIGLGAAILGSALFNNPGDTKVYHAPDYYRPYRRPIRGHWEERRVYIPPTYTRVWNPGHYNRRGKWKNGRWIEIQNQPGYWTTEQVWVSRRY